MKKEECTAPKAVAGKVEVPEAQLVPKWKGEFHSHQDWVNRAKRVLSVPRHKPGAICVDAKGRRCFIGADMARARDEGTFPVRYFWECELAGASPSPLPAPQGQQDERLAFEAAYLAQYPSVLHAKPEKFDREEDDSYSDTTVFVAWDMWQVARASLSSPAPMPAERQVAEELTDGGDAIHIDLLTGDVTYERGAASGVTAHEGHALRTVRRLLDGSQPRDIPGAIAVIDSVLATPSSPPVEIGESIDTPEFRELIHALDYTLRRAWSSRGSDLIAHIDQHTAQAVKAARNEASQWISVDERLPESKCLAVYKTERGQQFVIRARYIKRYEIEATGDECETDYNEADDVDYVKAGWYECIDNWGDFASVAVCEGVVTHWTSLPRSPSSTDANAGEGVE